MDSIIPSIHCEACARSAGPELIRCPQRASGGCPFVLVRGSADGFFDLMPIPATRQLWAMIAAVVGIVVSLFICYGSYSMLGLAGTMYVMVTVIAIGLLSVLLVRTAGNTTLTQIRTLESWTRTSVLGVPVVTTFYVHVQQETVRDTPAVLPDIPLSIAALHADFKGFVVAAGRVDDAVTVLRMALLGLLLRENVIACRGDVYLSRFLRPLKRIESASYRLAAVSESLIADGVIEGKLFKALTRARRPLPPFKLIRAFYGSNQRDPADWVISQALHDATKRGLAVQRTVYTGILHGNVLRYMIALDCVEQFNRAKESATEAWNDIHHQCPGLTDALRVQIKEAIISRVQPDDY